MTNQFPIPTVDIIPLPAPIWLISTLHLLTLSLHLIAMNLMVTSAFTLLLATIKSKRASGNWWKQLYHDLSAQLPTLVAMTVTLGVAPLLFVQLLYGHLVYTSSIAIGWWWFLIIPLLIIAYYLFYHMKLRTAPTLPALWKPLLAFLILLWISFTFSNNFNLSAQPERFSNMLLENTRGWWTNLSDPSTIPRWLHMILSALAVGGIYLMWFGRSKRTHDEPYGTFVMRYGYGLFTYLTMINIVVGFVFMMTLRRDVMMRMMGQGMLETILWFIGFLLAIAAIMIFNKSLQTMKKSALTLGTALMIIVLASMIILRELIRRAYLVDHFHLSDLKVETMFAPMMIFFILFAIGIALIIWMIKLYRQSAAK